MTEPMGQPSPPLQFRATMVFLDKEGAEVARRDLPYVEGGVSIIKLNNKYYAYSRMSLVNLTVVFEQVSPPLEIE